MFQLVQVELYSYKYQYIFIFYLNYQLVEKLGLLELFTSLDRQRSFYQEVVIRCEEGERGVREF